MAPGDEFYSLGILMEVESVLALARTTLIYFKRADGLLPASNRITMASKEWFETLEPREER